MKKDSQLRTLATLAKQRMKNGNYREIVDGHKSSIVSACQASTYFMCNARALKKEYVKAEIKSISLKDHAFEDKVIKLLDSSDMLINPLGILSDNEKIQSMNDFEKQQYILSLSDKFNMIKDQYIDGNYHIA